MAKANNEFKYTCAKRLNHTNAGFYSNIDPGISVRPPYNRDTYEYFRPDERIPIARTQDDYRKIMLLCRSAYERVGVIRSVIDMMSEFGAEGVEIVHPDKGPNEFYKNWARQVKLEDRAERFLSSFFKNGNTVVRRRFGKISENDLRQLQKVKLADSSATGRIPLEYVFYDPATVELVGGQLGSLSHKRIYALRVPLNLVEGYSSPRNDLEREVFNELPQEIKDASQGKSDTMLLLRIPDDKIHVAFYKKDDSDIWGKSFIYSILEDVFYNDKLKLAKTSGLDGFYNVIRLWKLGDHKAQIAASPDAGDKLASILEMNTGGGSADIIWDSAIDMTEYYPPIDKLANFEENLNNILLGLGVPEGLVGGEQKTSAMSANYLGLKNLIKRLEAGRRAIKDWLEDEITIIQKAMGFRKRPIVRFSNTDLHDEQTYYNLLIQLVDRNIISDETALERISEFVDIERSRVTHEEDLRESGELPPKASPYHKPDLETQQDHELNKIKVQDKLTKENNELNSGNIQRSAPKPPKQNGRPNGSRDTTKRNRAPNKVKSTVAKLIIDASAIYDSVDSYVKRKTLEHYNLASVRNLTSEQEMELDKVRLALFANIPPDLKSFTDDDLEQCLYEDQGTIAEFNEHYNKLLSDVSSENLTNDSKKILRLQAYAYTWGIDDYEDL